MSISSIKDIADNLDSSEYIRKETLRQKADDLAELFNYSSPQEKLQKLENNIGLFVKGGYDIWESLK